MSKIFFILRHPYVHRPSEKLFTFLGIPGYLVKRLPVFSLDQEDNKESVH
jgi:hypothetical protein